MVDLHGSCDARFEPMREAFERNFTELGDVGASFAMTLEGEFVVDLPSRAQYEEIVGLLRELDSA